ncbi:MAG: rRNA pseudouridine synthase [Ignavibacteriales bacterium]|nr:rRNA pseudouridine synthase [Ignavibacteriales bacterium]
MAQLEREDSNIHQNALRLNKFLAMAGVGSRRKNDELILSGAVKINGHTVQQLGIQVNPSKDHVTVKGKHVFLVERSIYIVLNKPKDCITTVSDEKGRTTVMDYVHLKERIFPIGRLDRNTTGVLLLTNDGDLANKLMHPRFAMEKVYRVTVDKPVVDVHIGMLKKGVKLEDGIGKAKAVELIHGSGRMKLHVVLHEGRNREVRRMFERLGYNVKHLERISFSGITQSGLPRGRWRHLTRREVVHLRQMTERIP